VHAFGRAGSAAAELTPPGTPTSSPTATTGIDSAATTPTADRTPGIAAPSRLFDTRRSVAEFGDYWIDCRM
jgi:hypothetical protein